MNQFIWGALAALGAVSATFMWKFWRRTHDPLFRAMATGFGILALHWLGLGVGNPSNEALSGLYLLRFFAFAIIIVGVIQKNRGPSKTH